MLVIMSKVRGGPWRRWSQIEISGGLHQAPCLTNAWLKTAQITITMASIDGEPNKFQVLAKHCACIISFNPHNNTLRQLLLFIPTLELGLKEMQSFA